MTLKLGTVGFVSWCPTQCFFLPRSSSSIRGSRGGSHPSPLYSRRTQNGLCQRGLTHLKYIWPLYWKATRFCSSSERAQLTLRSQLLFLGSLALTLWRWRPSFLSCKTRTEARYYTKQTVPKRSKTYPGWVHNVEFLTWRPNTKTQPAAPRRTVQMYPAILVWWSVVNVPSKGPNLCRVGRSFSVQTPVIKRIRHVRHHDCNYRYTIHAQA